MDARDAILAVVSREPDQVIKGRTLLQKRLYFLSILTGQEYEFHPHYFGPYSPVVTDALESLVGAGFLDEVVKLLQGPPGRFGERRVFQYALTPDGKQVVHTRKGDLDCFEAAIDKINAHPIANNAELLSIAAKVHYIVGEAHGASLDAIQARASELDWKLTPREINEVLGYLDHLGLVVHREPARL